MSRYTRTNTFPAGQKARGAEVKAEFDAVQQWAADMPDSDAVWSGNVNFVAAGGTGNAITVAAPDTWTTYVGKDGYKLSLKISADNTSAVTINVDGLGAKAVVRTDGTALQAADLKQNGIYDFAYNESQEKFYVTAFNGIAVAAAASATAAASSASAAATSATNAATSATAAAGSASSASTSASTATTQASNASTSATAAAASASAASTSATNAASSASAASTSASNAATSASTATTQATAAAASASAASTSASNASTSATNAANSASAAATSASNAATSATNAANSASAAAASAAEITGAASTANGIVYVNSSGALTSGSGLQYTATGLGIGGTPDTKLTVFQSADNITNGLLFVAAGGLVNGGWYHGGASLVGREGGVDAIHIAAGNIGILNNNPQRPLDVTGSVRLSSGSVIEWGGTVTNFITGNNTSNYVAIGTNSAERVRWDSAGNQGLGVTPSAWGSNYKALQVGATASVWSGAAGELAGLMSNTYFDNATYRYIINGTATRYTQSAGAHTWDTAPSGTAGAAITFTQAMTLDANNLLALGTATAVSLGAGTVGVTANGSAGGYYLAQHNGSNAGYMFGNSDNITISTFTGRYLSLGTEGAERMRFDVGGYAMIGTTANIGGAKLTLVSGVGGVLSKVSATADFGYYAWNAGTTGDNVFMLFDTEASATRRGSITYNRGGGLVAYNTTSDYRAKDIFGEYLTSGEIIDSLTVHLGQMKGSTLARPMFIAHEVQAVLPYAVTGVKDAANDDGTPKYQQMDHSSLIPLLTAEAKNTRSRLFVIENFKTATELKIAQLEQEIAALKAA